MSSIDWSLPIKYADECSLCALCEEPYCDECDCHYADCSHPGPSSDPSDDLAARARCSGMVGRRVDALGQPIITPYLPDTCQLNAKPSVYAGCRAFTVSGLEAVDAVVKARMPGEAQPAWPAAHRPGNEGTEARRSVSRREARVFLGSWSPRNPRKSHFSNFSNYINRTSIQSLAGAPGYA